MTRVIGLLVVGGLLVIGAPRPSHAQQDSAFSLVLEQSGTGWSARCNSGCRWTHLAFSFPGRAVRISISGVSADDSPDPDTVGFAFIVRSDPSGWTVSAIRGTAWQTASWRCPPAERVCRARISDAGVGGD
jgi:hypothetical protein